MRAFDLWDMWDTDLDPAELTDWCLWGQLDERLKREGVKTHKERVEELNRYLSNLSEHHDMYVGLLFLGGVFGGVGEIGGTGGVGCWVYSAWCFWEMC